MNILANLGENTQVSETAKFRDFEQDGSALRIPPQTVTRIIADFTQNTHMSEMGKFCDFEHESSALRI